MTFDFPVRVASCREGADEPYHIARRFASLDQISGGWNIVTTVNPDGALNLGLEEEVEHDERYVRASEFYDVVTGLWDSFADDAFIRDVKSGIYFDPAKIHVFGHQGKHLSVRGPLNIARPVQGTSRLHIPVFGFCHSKLELQTLFDFSALGASERDRDRNSSL